MSFPGAEEPMPKSFEAVIKRVWMAGYWAGFDSLKITERNRQVAEAKFKQWRGTFSDPAEEEERPSASERTPSKEFYRRLGGEVSQR